MRRVIIALVFCCLACRAERANLAAATDSAVSAPEASLAGRHVEAATATAKRPSDQRMIIRNATLSVIVRDAEETMRAVTAQIEGAGGYVAETRQWKEREQMRATATLRVPSSQLSATLSGIRKLALRTESESIAAQDVSQEYVDLEAQLRNLRVAETELLELLRTVRQRTEKAGEVIEIYNEVTRTRGEIERIQGRIQYLSQMTAFSTITLDLIPDVLAAPVVAPGWQPLATVKAASRALVTALKGVADGLIWLALYALPLALIFAAVLLALIQAWRAIRALQRRTAVRSPID
jgi:hypothetical protein